MSLSAVLYALSDQIIKNLAEAGEQSCSAVSVPIPKSTLSHHFKVLRESGVIHTRIEGTQRFISLRQEDLDSRFPGLLQIVLQADEPL
ncbi:MULTISPECIES: ArsR/SmtB family transcription factor [Bacillus]|uniref:ArsR/SmtB family transcription factor n=1 Tax=Bacillus TaxID=1386 RepID=UPI002243A5C7|nr:MULTISPECIES: helix-turn-helix domain-containing protein [Bacillus]MDN5388464.1 helix-turn-helix domain-containing protein [Bacillus sp. LB7]MEC1023174.1 helix-turn-helix domain-containing protein [Bacillus paralicheniformis]MEC1025740.1 helix-turn-helix domain-containing protein [Bacillus paralicheniformis]MEC1035844.1 helix-turn-helix domain-containing protein [Bacillus paralicheniformis]MEC1050018.1 helix-turn-helix domain-containing protein [Bacillus paralicheniformis]